MTAAGDLVAGRYLVEAHVGRGGMQDVYRASDTLLTRTVALKSPQLGQPPRRFMSSAKIAARVNHHSVAKTLDYLEVDGKQFLIEEFVEGVNLEDFLSHFGGIDPHLVAKIMHMLAKGVAASHHAGVVHRDIKPSNIIVGPSIAFTDVKLTDFGIASLTEEVFDEAARSGDLTRSTSGTIRGALPFMAPEVMFRQPGDKIGAAADVWSLGAMMYRLLSGDYPFGVYLEAAVNVKNGQRKSWPNFITSHPQYGVLGKSLQDLAERCMVNDTSARLTADQLADELSTLCYISEPREVGTINRTIQNGYSAFCSTSDGDVFVSIESLYGKHSRNMTAGDKLLFSRFPGTPRPRAHPAIKMVK